MLCAVSLVRIFSWLCSNGVLFHPQPCTKAGGAFAFHLMGFYEDYRQEVRRNVHNLKIRDRLNRVTQKNVQYI
ncbi:hypothetical protein SAMN04488054_11145 [Salibacterium qingdaonense]|uniref:Uncharacterized protein n=1 Tax=Salibacterium qingdaonense TaxID=266892 RepID=A0A1I4MDZ9_9BACI|nr:hypothetical protein SAMN04488054_11145 [Salibacterium qingdaonense]